MQENNTRTIYLGRLNLYVNQKFNKNRNDRQSYDSFLFPVFLSILSNCHNGTLRISNCSLMQIFTPCRQK